MADREGIDMTEATRWADVPGHPNYQVSDQGEVWSRPRERTAGGVLVPYLSPRGYHQVRLGNRNLNVHVLVCTVFHGDRPPGALTRHLNGNSLDNRAVNLTWGTPAENAADTLTHGTHHQARKTHCKRRHEFTEANTRVYRGRRFCRACDALRNVARRAALRT